MSERDELVADLAAHGRFLEGLTTIGVPPVAAAPAAQAPAAAAGAPAQASSTVALPAGTEAARGGTGAAGLAAVRADLGDCQRCRLAGGRKTIVFGQGNPEAELMFVGEAPGADEDEQGLAFVGRAGQLLTDIIEKGMKLRRADVFIANVLKCLRYNVPVLLEDGSWERIGRLVRQRYSGRVMSVAEDGTLVARRVVGWHATPLGGRSVYKLSHASSRGRGGKRCVTWLTGDHPVLTRRGWVKAEDLLESDDVAAPAGISRVAEQVIAGTLLGFDPAGPYEVRTAAIGAAGIALWDVLKSCTREGSLDSDIVHAGAVPNDLPAFLAAHPQISRVCFNGAKAAALYARHVLPRLAAGPDLRDIRYVRLPSTSPANAALRWPAKLEAWRAIVP